MRNFFAQLWNRIWLCLGGSRIENGFRFLSKDIIENRRLIGKQRGQIQDLEQRVWELEDHTMDETLAKTRKAVDEWAGKFVAAIDDRQNLEDKDGD